MGLRIDWGNKLI